MNYIKKKKIFHVIFFIFCLKSLQVSAQDPDCDYFQSISRGQTYYVYSKNYPDTYGTGKTCRWQAQCPPNTVCHISCTLEIPESPSCNNDRLLISRTGDSLLTGAEKYCGTGTLEVSSVSNSLSIALITAYDTPGGRFLCKLTAEPAGDGGGAACECGWQKQTRIVGGEETKVNEFPLMAGLVDYTRRVIACGATIIHNRWVVTAAHCLDSLTVSETGVLVGEHDISTGFETNATHLINAERFIKHPQYSQDQYDNDIGLVRTVTDIVYTEAVGPACLPFLQSSYSFEGDSVQAVGWGTTSFAGPVSDYLEKVTLKVVGYDTCRNSLGSIINEKKICTFEYGKDACQYDSGGPLVWSYNTRYYLVGIISVGYGCATSRPSANTRVTEFLNWIRENTPDAQYCSA